MGTILKHKTRMANKNLEIEARFLEINQKVLKQKLKKLKAKDLGEKRIDEIIFYDKKLSWMKGRKKFVRMRKVGKEITLTYKNRLAPDKINGTEEIEFKVGNWTAAQLFLERLGLTAYREQEKKRHTFKLADVVVDIDTWPGIPTFVEIEGKSEKSIKIAARRLGFDWRKAVFLDARRIIEDIYKIPVGKMKKFKFR